MNPQHDNNTSIKKQERISWEINLQFRYKAYINKKNCSKPKMHILINEQVNKQKKMTQSTIQSGRFS